MLTELAQIEKPVNASKQVITWDAIVEVECVEQLVLNGALDSWMDEWLEGHMPPDAAATVASRPTSMSMSNQRVFPRFCSAG
jgi:hypothetical protein